jgi:hypothetical protein
VLNKLYELWPTCPAEVLIGDSAFDIEDICRLCEVSYGLHPVFVRKPSLALVEHPLDADAFTKYRGNGQAYCYKHRCAMELAGHGLAPRTGLLPGEASREGGFRVRFRCPIGGDGDRGCGRPSLPMSTSWCAFPFYPHVMFGQPDKHAMRIALLARRNTAESHNSALKRALLVGGKGANRTHLTDFGTVRVVLDLAHLSRSALMLAAVRVDNDMQRVATAA